MTRSPARVTFFFLALATQACTGTLSSAIEKMAPDEGESAARSFLATLRDSSQDVVIARLDPALRTEEAGLAILQLGAGLRDFPPVTEARLVGFHLKSGPEGTTESYSFELSDSVHWAIMDVVFRVRDGNRSVLGFHGRDLPASLDEMTTLRLDRLDSPRGIVLGLALAGIAASVAGAVYAWRHAPRRRLLWVLLAVSGCGRYAVDWSSGDASISVLHWQLLSAGVFRSGYSPWVVSAGLPVGALLAWWLLRRRKKLSPPAPAS